MSPATRKPHKKSRHGCQECKRNRTKCDENRPSCGRCTRIGVKCSLLDPSSALIIVRSSSAKVRQATHDSKKHAQPVAPNVSPVPTPIPEQTPEQISNENRQQPKLFTIQTQLDGAEIERLRLMTCYSRSTAHSISDLSLGTKEGRSIWQVSIPDLAFQNDFLLHGLLSVTALHVALTDPRRQHENGILAIQHHNQGIALYSQHLQNITSENVDALFAFACLTTLYSFGIHLRGGLRLSPLVKVHEIFTMLRGLSIIVDKGKQWLDKGMWAPWFAPPFFEEEFLSGEVPDEIEAVLNLLTARIDSSITTSAQSDIYLRAIDALRKNFHQARLPARTHAAIVHFPICAPPEYLQMVCIGEPLSLAILANYAVTLHWLRAHVWLHTWGLETVKAVKEVLPPDWYDCIEWALQETEGPQEPFQLPTPSESEHFSSSSGVCSYGGQTYHL